MNTRPVLSSEEVQAFLREIYPNLLSFARHRLLSLRVWSVTPEDLIQQAVIQIMETQPGQLTNAAYVYSVIRNEGVQCLRREARQRGAFERGESVEQQLGGSSSLSPEDEVLQDEEERTCKEHQAALLRFVGECAREHGASAVIHALLDPANAAFFAGKKPREIASILGLSPRTISNYLLWIRKAVLPCAKAKMAQYLHKQERSERSSPEGQRPAGT